MVIDDQFINLTTFISDLIFYVSSLMNSLQPVQETREKQLKLWRELILKHCAQFNVHHLIPTSFPYFKNDSISRQLSSEAISAVIDYIIKTGAIQRIYSYMINMPIITILIDAQLLIIPCRFYPR